MKIKKIMKYQKGIKRLRLFRFIFKSQTRCISVSIQPCVCRFGESGFSGYYIMLFGLRVHYKKSGGGLFV